jgi:hypothetical protein
VCRTRPAWQRAIAAWLPRVVPLQRVKRVVGTALRCPDSAVPTAPPPLSELPRATSPRPSRQRSSRPRRRPVRSRPSLSKRPDRRCLAASTIASTPTVSEAEPPLAVFHPWSNELTSPSLLPIVGPLPATIAPPHQKNAITEPVFSPSPSTRSSGELSPPPPCPPGSLTVEGARPPPFAPPPPLWRRHRPHRDARPGAVTAPACVALRRAIAGRTGRGRQAQPARCAHEPRQHREHGARPAWPWATHTLCTWATRHCATGPNANSAQWHSN